MLLAGQAWGSSLTDVRAGVHPDFTRVVLQLDASTPYSLTRLVTKENGTRVLYLSVKAAPPGIQRVAPRGSPHVKGVAVSGRPDGTTDIRIRLRGDLELKEMVLRGPDRVVLDFYAAGSGNGPMVSALAPPESSGGTSETAVARTPRTEPTIEESHDAEFNQALAEAESALEEAKPEARVAEVEPAGEEFQQGLEAEVVAVEADTEVAGTAFDEGAESAGVDPDAETASGAFAGVEVAELVPDEPAEAAPAITPSEPAEDSDSSSMFGSPFAMAAIAGVALIGLLFVLGRRRKGDDDDENLSPLDAAEDGRDADAGLGGLFDGNDVEQTGQEVVDADAPAPFVGESPTSDIEPEAIIVSDDADDTNDSTSEETTMDEGFDYPAISPTSSGDTPLSAPSDFGNSEVSKVVEEFERRIAHLESRLEEVFDAKDRLERQVAAQTEELRVQRAAIARTQRVLRTIARPEDDEPSEPVPKL